MCFYCYHSGVKTAQGAEWLLCFSSRQETWPRHHLKRSLSSLNTQQALIKLSGFVLHPINIPRVCASDTLIEDGGWVWVSSFRWKGKFHSNKSAFIWVLRQRFVFTERDYCLTESAESFMLQCKIPPIVNVTDASTGKEMWHRRRPIEQQFMWSISCFRIEYSCVFTSGK